MSLANAATTAVERMKDWLSKLSHTDRLAAGDKRLAEETERLERNARTITRLLADQRCEVSINRQEPARDGSRDRQ